MTEFRRTLLLVVLMMSLLMLYDKWRIHHGDTSLLALIEWWLDNNMKPASAQMGKVYKSLIIDSTMGALGSLSAVSE